MKGGVKGEIMEVNDRENDGRGEECLRRDDKKDKRTKKYMGNRRTKSEEEKRVEKEKEQKREDT